MSDTNASANPARGNPTTDEARKDCPYCMESIKADAIKCSHCGSMLEEPSPTHGGTCPYCKENINPEAVKCSHCGSRLSVGRDWGIRASMAGVDLGRLPTNTLSNQSGWPPSLAPSLSRRGYLHDCRWIPVLETRLICVEGLGCTIYYFPTGEYELDCRTD